MSYPGQRHYGNHQNQYNPPQGPPPYPPYGQGQYYHSPPPVLSRSNHDFYPPPQPRPNAYNHSYRAAPYGAPPPPPQVAQQFNQQIGGQYTFQYSQCTGKRKALLIGINYFGTSNELRGCINDVRNMSQFMNQRYNFSRDDMVILTDDQANPMGQPTRANIIRAMRWLVQDAHPNDNLFFHYSGHGGQTEDLDGDEEDGYDETIYPVDFKGAGMIVDDEMHDIMVRSLPTGCRLTAIFDCCHSGSALDLPYEYGMQGVLKEPNLLAEAGQGLLGAGLSYLRGDMSGVISAGSQLLKKFTTGRAAKETARRTKTSSADVIQFSGCKDNQTSADAVEAGQATGAMSWAFRETLMRKPQQSYHELLVNIRELLAGKYQQKPVLSASHPIDTSLLFII